ncbi:hypothetical protein GCM10010121_064920 [Streptomyces brasiliensis]|uniref:Uncharacterized protein n=1 Tax=Streptomyces brasiliensis TaxID=1954 RepID=A0A917L6P4_9ACTN|nr:hypothetical protein GCM10010121_064920 [Streptomyces brasiliensis]
MQGADRVGRAARVLGGGAAAASRGTRAETHHESHRDERPTRAPVLPPIHRLPTPSRYVRHGPPVVPFNDGWGVPSRVAVGRERPYDAITGVSG